MRLVAAARVRRAADAALSARPFADALQARLGGLVAYARTERVDVGTLAARERANAKAVLDTPFVAADDAAQRRLMDRLALAILAEDDRFAGGSLASTLVVVITSDRGFAGPYNKEVIALANRRVRELQCAGGTVSLALIGRQAIRHFARVHPGLTVLFSEQAGSSRPAHIATHAAALCDVLLAAFLTNVQRVEVVYTRFSSLLANYPAVRTLLPVSPQGLEQVDDEVFQPSSHEGAFSLVPYSKSPAAARAVAAGYDRLFHDARPASYPGLSDEEVVLLLQAILPMYIHSQLARMLRESVAAELASRMAAMQAASDNATDIIESLQGRYHRVRQAKITDEVIMVSTHNTEEF
jgi:F-type H+-transporting ATPase subunit gamma